jgi:release factor glutamine methyltransferase
MSHSKLYQELLKRLTTDLNTLPDKPEENPHSILRGLWHAAAGTPKSAELACISNLPTLDASAESRLRSLAEQHIAGVPLAHITGRQRFLGMEMLAGPEALVPRKETELLAHTAVELASTMVTLQASATMVDVCTGSGNVALAVAHRVPAIRIFGADISEAAVGLARRNALHLGLDGRVQFCTGDLLAPFDTSEFLGKVDLLTCNPPYIASAKVKLMPNEISAHEPHAAFDGGPFGVAIIFRIFQEAPRFLRRGGWLVTEIGLGQGPILAKQLKKNSAFEEIRTVEDANGAVRVILGRC